MNPGTRLHKRTITKALLALFLLSSFLFGAGQGADPTGVSGSAPSGPPSQADVAAQAFEKATYVIIPLDEPPDDSFSHEYSISCVTDTGEVDFMHYFSADPENPYSGQEERLLWTQGEIDAATFFSLSDRSYAPMNRVGQYTYLEHLPDFPGGGNAGVKGRFVCADGTGNDLNFPKYEAEITAQVLEFQKELLVRNGGWSSVSISPLTDSIVRSFNFYLLEDGTAFNSIRQSREYSRTRIHIEDGTPQTNTLSGSETICTKWGH